jgi:ppGpp synthetase/RelA/SpoT-type nucleotidyltranferase
MSSRTPPARPGPEPVAHAVRTYAAAQPALVPVTDAFAALVTELLDDAGINYLSVTSRTKTVASFAGKAMRTGPDGQVLYTDPLHEITDTIGVRVITYVHSDVAAVADVLAEELTILADRDLGEETAREGGFGYASRHMLVEPDPARPLAAAYDVASGHQASLQVRTVLQHAWAEFEHDIRYKGSIPEADAPDLDRRFTLAAGLLELADREFSSIRARLEGTPGHRTDDDSGDPRISRAGAGHLPLRRLLRRRLVAHRPLRVDRGPAARARHHLARRAQRADRVGRQHGHPRPDGLQVPHRRRPAPRRRAARHLRRGVRRADRQRAPRRAAAHPAGQADRVTG